MRAILGFILCFLLAGEPSLAFAREQPGGKLLKVVALSRHGVRAPTQSDRVLNSWSQKSWPDWPVKKGDLTERGARLVTAMWQNLRTTLIDKGLLPDAACPPANTIYIRADSDERTRATAYAMTQGLGRDCSLGYGALEIKVDPLFHPVKAGLYHFSAARTAIDILAMTHGGLENFQDRLSQPMALLDNIMGPPAPALCSRFTFSSNCSLSDLPNAISVSSDGGDVKLVGALSIASSVAEIFLLEYGQWPGEAAGWGQVNARVLSQILPVHSAVFDVVNRAPMVSWARGGFLLQQMAAALEGKHSESHCNDAKLVIFVGHDTNIANIGGLLGLDWKLDGYPDNGIPPAAVLFLELWEKNGKKEVKVNFYAQPMEALHTSLDLASANVELFRPLAASVTSPPIVGEAAFDLDKFLDRVQRMTEGAPVTRQTTPKIFYAPPEIK